MEIIGKFKLGKATYVIVLENDKYKVGKLTFNIVNYNLTSEEKVLIMHVIDGILPNNFKTTLFPIKVNKNKYDVSVSNGIYEFYPSPNMEDLKVLNNLLNNQNEFVYFGKNSSIDSNYIKRFVKLGKKTVLVLLSATILLSSTSCMKSDIKEQFNEDKEIISELPDDDKIITIIDEKTLENEDEEVVETDELPTEVVEKIQNGLDNRVVEEKKITERPIKAYNFNDIMEAVNTNPNLTDAEKTKILSSVEIFEDNYGYYDYEILLNRLNTLRISYISQSNSTIQGSYNYVDNYMEFYHVNDLSNVKDTTFFHELYHMISLSNSNYNNISFLIEGANSIAVNEYLKVQDNSTYGFERNVVKMLGEIAGADVIKKMYMSNNSDYLYNALLEIDSNTDKADSLMFLMDEYEKIFQYNFDADTLQELSSNILDYIKYYYELKYDRSVDCDLIMNYYMDKNAFCDNLKLDEYAKNYVTLDDEPSYINTINRNKEWVFSVPVSTHAKYESTSLDMALEMGMISLDESGNYVLPDNCYLDGNNIMSPIILPSAERTTFSIASENRYMNDNLSR